MNLFRNCEHSVQCKGACMYARAFACMCAWVCMCVCHIHLFHFGLTGVLNTQLFKAVTSVKEFSYILCIYQSSCPVIIL